MNFSKIKRIPPRQNFNNLKQIKGENKVNQSKKNNHDTDK